MAAKKNKPAPEGQKVVARNRRARFHFHLEETVEAGICLVGTEVRSLREGAASLEQAWCRIDQGEVWLVGANVPSWRSGSWSNHEPCGHRKLLLHRRQIRHIEQQLKIKGRTLIPVQIYFNAEGRVKVEIALATGRKQHDKRQLIAERDSRREMARNLRQR